MTRLLLCVAVVLAVGLTASIAMAMVAIAIEAVQDVLSHRHQTPTVRSQVKRMRRIEAEVSRATERINRATR